jgi:4-hydroxy-tetrahydrodipicolinate synthase
MQTALNANQANQADTDFSGLWIPLVTPFDQGQVDQAALKRLVAHYRGSGIAGLVVCGSTGEAAALDEDEQLQTLQTVMAEAPGLPVVMGLSGYHLGKTAARIKALGTLGPGRHPAAGAQLYPALPGRPHRMVHRPGRRERRAGDPLRHPYRTGSRLDLETILALAGHPRIQALKDCGGDPAKTRALIADGRLQVLAGEDVNIFSTVAQGGRGAIAAAAHLHTARFVEVLRRIQAGDLAGAEALWAPLQPLIEACLPNPTRARSRR